MPRIRTIKPDFWRNPELSQVSAEAALLAIGLLNIADDEGYFVAIPKLIESDIFPLRECSVSTHGMLHELSNAGYIRLFSGTDGRPYGHVVNFVKHQIVSRATPSKIKHLESLTEDSLSTHGVLTEDSLPERKGKEEERKGKEEAQGKPARSRFDPESVELPECVPSGLWAEWCRFRKESGKRLTETSVAQQLRDLQAWHSEGYDIAAIVKTSIASSWSGLFAPKTKVKVASKAAFDAFLDDKTIEGEWA